MNERLKQIRLCNKISQEEFGKRIGIESRAHISALENGNRNITDRIINDVCRVFSINKEWLLTGNGEMYQKKSIIWGEICADIAVNDPKAQEAIIKYYELSEEDKELWWKWVEHFMK